MELEGELIEFRDGELIVGFKQDAAFQYETSKRSQNKVEVERELEEALGQKIGIKMVLFEKDLKGKQMEPIIKKAIEIFNAEEVRSNGQRIE